MEMRTYTKAAITYGIPSTLKQDQVVVEPELKNKKSTLILTIRDELYEGLNFLHNNSFQQHPSGKSSTLN